MDATNNAAERVFHEYLGQLDRDEACDVSELCRRHPELDAELRALHADWAKLRPMLGDEGGVHSIHTVLHERLGLEADPTISLPDSLDGPDDHGHDARVLLETLAQRTSSKTRYRLLGEVARGGMGVILKVWDGDLRRHLAMKVILDRSSPLSSPAFAPTDARIVSRFLEEAQITGQLDHPSIVPVHELGLSPEGRVYFTMRLVRGRELSEIYELAWSGAEGWSQTRALGVLLRVCEAVAFAHAKGVVHRDLKPANVMVGRFGQVYVMDWGLARVVGAPDRHDLRIDVDNAALSGVITDRSETPVGESPLKTMDGDIIGTPTFMAPEQALGRLSNVGPQSDVYALGSMLYHLLARTPPYVGLREKVSQREVLSRLMVGPPAPLSRVAPQQPQELVAICEKAMARSIEERYANVGELADDLRAFLENRVVRAHRTGALVELKLWVRRNRGLAAASAAALVLALGGALAVAFVTSRANEEISNTRDELAARNKEYEEATGGLERARLELADAAAEREAMAENLAVLESEINLGRSNVQELAKQSERLRMQLKDKDTDLAMRTAEASAKQGEVDQLAAEVGLQRSQSDVLKRMLDDLQAEREQLMGEVKILRTEKSQLEAAGASVKKDGN